MVAVSPMAPDDLLAVARLFVDRPLAEAAERIGFSEAVVEPYLSDTGLTERGRALAGDRAPEIDQLVNRRLDLLHAWGAGAEPAASDDTEAVLAWLEKGFSAEDLEAMEADFAGAKPWDVEAPEPDTHRRAEDTRSEATSRGLEAALSDSATSSVRSQHGASDSESSQNDAAPSMAGTSEQATASFPRGPIGLGRYSKTLPPRDERAESDSESSQSTGSRQSERSAGSSDSVALRFPRGTYSKTLKRHYQRVMSDSESSQSDGPPSAERASGRAVDRQAMAGNPVGAASHLPLAGPRSLLVTPDHLLHVAKYVAAGGSIAKASNRLWLNKGTVGEYLTRGGLRDRGRALVGREMAAHIDDLMSRNPLKTLSSAQMPHLRMRDLLNVARRVADGQSIAAAADAEDVSRSTIRHYLGPRGLSERGRSVVSKRIARVIDLLIGQGELRRPIPMEAAKLRAAALRVAAGEPFKRAARLSGLGLPGLNGNLTTTRLTARGAKILGEAEAKKINALLANRKAEWVGERKASWMTPEQLWDIGVAVARGETMQNAADAVEVKRTSANDYLTASGLRGKGRALLGERKAAQLDALFAARPGHSHTSSHVRRVSSTSVMTPELLWKIAARVAKGDTVQKASDGVQIKRQSANTYMTANGLRDAGRELLGEEKAAQLDALFATRKGAVSVNGRRVTVTPEVVADIAVELARAKNPSVLNAAKSRGFKPTTLKTYLTSTGLTQRGRKYVGEQRARAIDKMAAAV